MSNVRKRLEQEGADLQRAYGRNAAVLGTTRFALNTVPTGSLALDYALGTGGWPRRHMVEVFGAPDIGKSSVVGLNAIRNAQAQNLLCGLIAMEPGFDPDWAERHGVDLERLLVVRPRTGEEGFSILHRWLNDDLIDAVLFDSIGALLHESEMEEDGKAKSGGQAQLITWGMKAAAIPAWRNNKLVIYLNQQRDDRKSPIAGQVEAPGGWAIKHLCPIRVHLRQSAAPFKETIDGEKITIGRQVTAHILRNKCSEGSNKKAQFDYYLMETDEHPLGIDVGRDVINTAMRTGVIKKAGGYYRHSSFPGKNTQFQGRDPVSEFLLSTPSALEKVRQEVLGVMVERQGPGANAKPDLKVVDSE